MNSRTLEKWQAAAIRDALYSATNYLLRLRRRMEETGFTPDNPHYRQAWAAHETANTLRMTAHYLSCSGTESPRAFGQV